MAFTWQDILTASYSILNQNGITPLVTDWWFTQAINSAINNVVTYKGYLWSWQNDKIELELDETKYNTEVLYTHENPILAVQKVFIDDWNWYQEVDHKLFPMINYAYPLTKSWYSYVTSEKVIKYKIDDTRIKKILFSIYRWVDSIATLSDTINMPNIMKPAVLYFTLSEIIPVYHTFEQGRDINYHNRAIEYLEWVRAIDNIQWDRITATIV